MLSATQHRSTCEWNSWQPQWRWVQMVNMIKFYLEKWHFINSLHHMAAAEVVEESVIVNGF